LGLDGEKVFSPEEEATEASFYEKFQKQGSAGLTLVGPARRAWKK